MADLDDLRDAKGEICNYIVLKIRELFEMTTNEFNFPPWIQANNCDFYSTKIDKTI